MRKISLDAVAREQLERARNGPGRSASTVFGGHEQSLRQTVMAMVAGSGTGEHASPGEATLQVLIGRIRLIAGDDVWEGRAGDLLFIPPADHSVAAVDDAAILLTVSKS
jgi:quercetin dioxygenase-like cupin family protein